MTYPTLEHVAMEARPYPAHLLEGCETGLCLFAAAFLGHNDAVWFAEAGLRTTCVDIDGERLEEMREIYPVGWSFRGQDAFRFAELRREDGQQWDAVSVDTFTGDMMERSLGSLDLWCSLSRKVVTATYTEGARFVEPQGWTADTYERATGVYWLVLTRA